jgi:Glycosyl hydrolase catalytic core
MLGRSRLIGGLAAVGIAAAIVAGAVAPGAYAPVRGDRAAGQVRLVSDAAAHASKKGVSAWTFRGVDAALRKSGASWYYTWGSGHQGIKSRHGVQFVPMIWGPADVARATLRQARREGPYLLGFNEPDNAGQSNMTVAQALALWPRLMATHLTLGSPAVAAGAAAPGGWLDQFMKGAKADGYRVNFIAVHWYGADFATGAAVHELESYLRAIHSRYHLPIWLTEFALIRFAATTVFPSAAKQAAFVTAATSMLQRLTFVRRYAWFALPATAGDGTAGLFRPGAAATRAGRAFEAVRS